MSVIRVGSSGGYAAGWEAIFGGGRKPKAAGGKAVKGKASKQKTRVARPAKSAKKRAAAKKARRR